MRESLLRAKTWVLKLGTRVCVGEHGRLNGQLLLSLASQISILRQRGCRICLVSSGAIGMARELLQVEGLEDNLPSKQALAAMGQVELMNGYKDLFAMLGINVAQVLLTRDDVAARDRYLNARNTLNALLKYGVLPIINENDSVSTGEIRFGDNDSLSAMVGSIINADVVVNFTSAAGVLAESVTEQDMAMDSSAAADSGSVVSEIYESNNGERRAGYCLGGKIDKDTGRRIVDLVWEVTPQVEALDEGTTTRGGTGGLTSKLRAAKMVMRYGGAMVVAPAKAANALLRLASGEHLGTLFEGQDTKLNSRQRWLAEAAKPEGLIVIDKGAARALSQGGSSLLAVGVVDCEGGFRAGDLVNVVVKGNEEEVFARGLCNYSQAELASIMGQSTARAAEILGHPGYSDVIHCDNMVLLLGQRL